MVKGHMREFTSSNPGHTKVKIAILDTGYDPFSPEFVLRDRRKRFSKNHWKDFAGDSPTPIDENGHGTRVQWLMMQVAPFVDIYVARIARHCKDLENSHSAIEKAIKWATEDCQVDIISMFFGFDDENYSATGNPIRQAIDNARGSRPAGNILFYAAAGNEGGNQTKVMFPAKHDLVTPIYGTRSTGEFMDGLNPIPPSDGHAIFGTYADEIPCAGRQDEDEARMTGTSFATAIAAGLAGMLLEYIRVMERKHQQNYETSMPWSTRLGTKAGMEALFKTFSKTQYQRRYYLYPPAFFRRSEEENLAHVKTVYHAL
ncbi:peptidase S8/S53 domain-containing protein [Elsinoe ampelina]|uniref:Peptidase S8/S53 domain-containing protein n=1 Tax=Elsinoe ampelina TaxID=302913 RepID=A0A6A6GBB3_9PEZI|nr:peptidase S8/S53 domain-containing protein [Elsinoe ampelina]